MQTNNTLTRLALISDFASESLTSRGTVHAGEETKRGIVIAATASAQQRPDRNSPQLARESADERSSHS